VQGIGVEWWISIKVSFFLKINFESMFNIMKDNKPVTNNMPSLWMDGFLIVLLTLSWIISQFTIAFFKVNHPLDLTITGQTFLLKLTRTLHLLRVLLIVAPIVSLIVIAMVLFINRRFFPDGMRLIGKTTLLTSLGILLGSGILLVFGNAYFTPGLFAERLGLSVSAITDLFPVALEIGETFLFYVGLTAFVGFVIGLIFILIARVLERKTASLA
jgi:hypothetical protein